MSFGSLADLTVTSKSYKPPSVRRNPGDNPGNLCGMIMLGSLMSPSTRGVGWLASLRRNLPRPFAADLMPMGVFVRTRRHY